GVNSSGVPDKGYIEISVRRDEGTEGPVPDDDDYWWNGSTWTAKGPTPQWFDLVELGSSTFVSGEWTYSGLKCADDDARRAFTCWVRGKKHWVQVRAGDRAGNLQSPAAAQDVRIQAAVSKFVIIPEGTPPYNYVAGEAHPVRVEARDDLDGIAAGFTGQVRFMTETAGAPEMPGDGLPADDAAVFVNGIAPVVNGLNFRMAGGRDLKVCKLDAGVPNCAVFGAVNVTVTTAAVDRLLILNAEQTHRPGCVSQNDNCAATDGMGRQGSPSPKTAGTAYNVRVLAVDQFYNVDVSSEPLISLTSTDPRDDAEANYTGVTLIGGNQAYGITPRSKGAARTVSVSGAGVAGSWNTTHSMEVRAKTVAPPDRKLLVLLPGEVLDPDYAAGKRPCPGDCPSQQTAGSTFTVVVYAADEYMNYFSPTDNIGVQPSVWLETSDPYDVHPSTVQLSGGTTDFPVNMYQASTQTVSAKTL
ncbi:MAG TPA: hypothetical protein PK523_12665, partial [Elusimicrobiales bacterium]|nr:hypothetical protein [Elusimicrobiales bacterium]